MSLQPGRNTLAANVRNGAALGSFPGRYAGALAPGGERSRGTDSTAHAWSSDPRGQGLPAVAIRARGAAPGAGGVSERPNLALQGAALV